MPPPQQAGGEFQALRWLRWEGLPTVSAAVFWLASWSAHEEKRRLSKSAHPLLFFKFLLPWLSAMMDYVALNSELE